MHDLRGRKSIGETVTAEASGVTERRGIHRTRSNTTFEVACHDAFDKRVEVHNFRHKTKHMNVGIVSATC